MLPSPPRNTTSFCPKAYTACGLPSPKFLVSPRQCQPRANLGGAASASMCRTSSVSDCNVMTLFYNRGAGNGANRPAGRENPATRPFVRPSVVAVPAARSATIPANLPVRDTTVDLLVVGSGTGMAAALAAAERGLRVLIVEKSAFVGGSTARSGGALWFPASPVLDENDAGDTASNARTYLDSVVDGTAAPQRSAEFVTHLPETVEMLRRMTPLKF